MRIYNFNNTYDYKLLQTTPKVKHYPYFGARLSLDSFERKTPALNKLKNFTIAEYKNLTGNEIRSINRSIRQRYGSSFDKYIQIHDIAAAGIKEKLDKVYGEGNYVFIPIGRSLSSIGKCLSMKIGEENVKMLPMSRAARFFDIKHFIRQSGQIENISLFCKYLSSIGLSKHDVETSGKMYIFSDFCCTGGSLMGAQKLFKSSKVWGEQPNVRFFNILNLVDKVEPTKIRKDVSLDNSKFKYDLEDLLYESTFKRFSLVYECRDVGLTKSAVIKPEEYSLEAKAFYFKLLDNEATKDSDKFILQKLIALIRHHN